MLPFKLIYSDGYYLPIGEHVFPAEKYRRIRDRLLAEGVAEANDFLDPKPATDQDILLVHTQEYVHKLKTGTLSPREQMELEIPYSPELVASFWLAAGGSILAGRQALSDGVGINSRRGLRCASGQRHSGDFCGKANCRRAAAFSGAVDTGVAPADRRSSGQNARSAHRRGLHHFAASAQ